MNSNFWARADADSKALGGHVELAEGVWGNPTPFTPDEIRAEEALDAYMAGDPNA